MKKITIAAVNHRAERLNQPEVLEQYYQLALETTDKEFLLKDEDHKHLNTLWDEILKIGEPIKPRSKTSKGAWNKIVEEIHSSGNETWINLLKLKQKQMERLTPCQVKARKKKLAEDWEAFKSAHCASLKQ